MREVSRRLLDRSQSSKIPLTHTLSENYRQNWALCINFGIAQLLFLYFPSTKSSIHLLSTYWPIPLTTKSATYPFIHRATNSSIHLPTQLPIEPSIHTSIYLPMSPLVDTTTHQWPSIHSSTHLLSRVGKPCMWAGEIAWQVKHLPWSLMIRLQSLEPTMRSDFLHLLVLRPPHVCCGLTLTYKCGLNEKCKNVKGVYVC